MTALHALSYVAGAAAFLFVLLSLASGLLYIAEVIEEHSALSKSIGQKTIYVIILILVALHFFDGLPLYLTALGVFSHLVYLQNFSRTWPSISLTSIAFIASCLLVVVSHFASFRYFSERSRAAGYNYNSYNKGRWGAHGSHLNTQDSFVDVATYFGVCVWLCPFFLFLSLSANDNVLPSSGDIGGPAPPHRAPGSPTHSRKQSSMLKSALSSAFRVVPKTLRPTALTSITSPRHASNQRDGLLVSSQPSSPIAYSHGGNGVGVWGNGGGDGSPSPSLAFGFQAPPNGSDSPGPDGVPSRLKMGVPSMSRRHTTEEGFGLGVGAATGPGGPGLRISPSAAASINMNGGGNSYSPSKESALLAAQQRGSPMSSKFKRRD